MKLNLICRLAILAVCVSIMACEQNKNNQNNESVSDKPFTIKRGTNIPHWLSQSEKRGDERAVFFTRKDIDYIHAAGFDHIRLPIDKEQMWDTTGKRNAESFELLKHSLEWCQEVGLRVVVDLRIPRSHNFNAKEKSLWTVPSEQDKFIALWKDLSGFLHEWPHGMVAYELINEPVADDAEQWNTLLAKVVDSIRLWEPERVLVIGSNRWQSADTFDQLRVPKNDAHILLSFHFYEPFFLSHYQASWTNLKEFKGEVNYPGQIVLHSKLPEHQRVYNRDTLLKIMQKPLRLADSLKLPLYCGEFGVINNAPRESKVAWYRDMVSLFEAHGIAYANWNYKAGAFGIVDKDLKPDLELVRILTHNDK